MRLGPANVARWNWGKNWAFLGKKTRLIKGRDFNSGNEVGEIGVKSTRNELKSQAKIEEPSYQVC